MVSLWARGACVAVALLAATHASAQNFPDHPMTLIIPFATG